MWRVVVSAYSPLGSLPACTHTDLPHPAARYRKIAGDRSEKNMRYAPAAVEMSGVAALMLDYMRKDIDTELERAYSMYQRTNQPRLWCVCLSDVARLCAFWHGRILSVCVACVRCRCMLFLARIITDAFPFRAAYAQRSYWRRCTVCSAITARWSPLCCAAPSDLRPTTCVSSIVSCVVLYVGVYVSV